MTLGLPGALPVLNRHAVELAMRIGLALNCRIQPCSFHRKNYFYPDMPKAYQISQYDVPLNVDGWLDLPDGTRVGIERAHLEEDTGKSTHVGGSGGRIHGSDASLIDFNRAGVPLVEIVGRPDIRTAEQARQYVNELRAILVAVGASDAKMEEGSMRVDANVSVRRPGEPLGTRCEIKNLNSVRSLGRAIDYEARRQIDLLEAGEVVRQETRHWDEGDGRTHTLRTQGGRRRLPVLPRARPRAARARRRVDRPGPRRPADAARRPAGPGWPRPPAPPSTARPSPSSSSGARTTTCWPSPRPVATRPGRSSTSRRPTPSRARAPAVPAADLAALTTMETGGQLTATQAKQVLAELVAAGGGDPAAIAAAKGFEAMDTSALEALVDDAIAANAGGVGEVPGRRGQGDRRPRRRRDEGVARSGRRRRRHGAAAQPAQLSPPLSCARRLAPRPSRPLDLVAPAAPSQPRSVGPAAPRPSAEARPRREAVDLVPQPAQRVVVEVELEPAAAERHARPARSTLRRARRGVGHAAPSTSSRRARRRPMTSTRRSVTPMSTGSSPSIADRPPSGHRGPQLLGRIEEVEQVLLLLVEVGHPPVIRPAISFFGESGSRAHVGSFAIRQLGRCAEHRSLMCARDRIAPHRGDPVLRLPHMIERSAPQSPGRADVAARPPRRRRRHRRPGRQRRRSARAGR